MAYLPRTELSSGKKYLIYGLSASAVAVFSYFMYKKLSNPKRSQSQSSSDSENELDLLHQISKRSVASSSKSKENTNEKLKENQEESKHFDNNQRKQGQKAKKNGQIPNIPLANGHNDHIPNRQMEQIKNLNFRRALLFDSNDEMIYSDELYSDDFNLNRRNYTKVPLRIQRTEEERRRLHEKYKLKKKESIEQFLHEVNEKKTAFINQKKKSFKEDFVNQQINSQIVNGHKQRQGGSASSSTRSGEENLGAHSSAGAFNNYNLENMNKIQQQQYLKQNQQQMASLMQQNRGGRMELKPEDFNTKEKSRWFNIFQMYTNNYIQEEEQNQEYIRKQQLESYYSNKKRSASASVQ